MTGHSIAELAPIAATETRALPRTLARAWIVPVFCLALLTSSALLFLAELMFARMVLPLLGGTPAVWNTCMVSFQALLLAAYAYGHWSMRWLGTRRQAALHVLLLILSGLALPIAVPHGWEPPAGKSPIGWLLMALTLGVGVPFFAVASTAPVLQQWFSTTGHRAARDPYFLYAASNLGSIAALIAFPALFEPLMRLADQSHLWTAGYVALIAIVGLCATCVGGQQQDEQAMPPIAAAEPIPLRRRLRWVMLAAVPSSLLLGTTTFITTDIAAVPLLWVVPLALYLLSFILVFSSRPLLSHGLMVRLQPVVVLGVALFMLARVAQPVWMVLSLHLAALFISSMVCHGELAADRPSSARLTDFYLTMSLGGVIGGLFNALLAPVIFHAAAEYPIALVAACALCPVLPLFRTSGRGRGRGVNCENSANFATSALSPALSHECMEEGERCAARPTTWHHYALDVIVPAVVAACAWGMPRALVALTGHDVISVRMLGLGAAAMIAVTALRRRPRLLMSVAAMFVVAGMASANGEQLSIERSFFGIHRVVRNAIGPFNDLFHGTTVHGRQLVQDGRPTAPTTALTYYHRTGPVGELFAQRTADGQADRVGVVGMGVGSLAAYAGPTTRLTYYEIDPAVRWMAQDSGHFTFLKSAAERGASVTTIMGDARLTVREAPHASYDVLVIDAFSGDSVPVHLLTREAMQSYLDKLAPGGVLVIHVSNMYLNLLPVCAALAADAGTTAVFKDDLDVTPQQAAEGKCASQWVLIARPGATALPRQWNDARWKPLPAAPASMLWTDDFSNVLSVFRWR